MPYREWWTYGEITSRWVGFEFVDGHNPGAIRDIFREIGIPDRIHADDLTGLLYLRNGNGNLEAVFLANDSHNYGDPNSQSMGYRYWAIPMSDHVFTWNIPSIPIPNSIVWSRNNAFYQDDIGVRTRTRDIPPRSRRESNGVHYESPFEED